MSKRTDEELTRIINSSQGDYQPEAVKAAEQEIKKRQFVVDKQSKYSDDQILEILNLRNNYPEYEVQAAEIEAKKRNIEYRNEAEDAETAIRKRYPALRFISGLYKVLAWLVCALSVVASIYLIFQGEVEISIALGVLIVGGILFVSLLAIAEIIKVFIDIEHNTRISATNTKIK